jgi:hypothetical protein
MTAEEILANITAHGACLEGIVWAAGMDSATAWSTNDPNGIKYLFWWAVKNAGRHGWKNSDNILVVVNEIVDATCTRLSTMKDIVREDFAQVTTLEQAMSFLVRLEREIICEDPNQLTVWTTEILTIVKKLSPTI